MNTHRMSFLFIFFNLSQINVVAIYFKILSYRSIFDSLVFFLCTKLCFINNYRLQFLYGFYLNYQSLNYTPQMYDFDQCQNVWRVILVSFFLRLKTTFNNILRFFLELIFGIFSLRIILFLSNHLVHVEEWQEKTICFF